mgnify:CR=1 FL=1
MGVWGIAPSGVRAAAPHSAPSHGEGVWGFGKDAEIERPKALQGRKAHKAFLKGLENLLCFYKNRLFLQAATPTEFSVGVDVLLTGIEYSSII